MTRRRTAQNGLAVGRADGAGDSRDAWRDVAVLQRTLNRLRGRTLAPSGVYRFHTHEEADLWMMRQMASPPARQKSKTSSPSAAP
jgi:hypothetical protein